MNPPKEPIKVYRSKTGIPAKLRALGRGAALVASMSLLAACTRPFPTDQVPKMKILIMNFEMAPGLRETQRAIRGWWLGASTIYQNPRAGAMFAERLTARLAPYSFLNLFTRTDLKYYFARKRQMLTDAYDYLDDEEIDELMQNVPPLDFARELNADMVLSGRVIENDLETNRTIHWWSSFVHVECRLTDVLTGKVEWEKDYRMKKWFASQLAVQDEISKLVAADLKEEYFRPLVEEAYR